MISVVPTVLKSPPLALPNSSRPTANSACKESLEERQTIEITITITPIDASAGRKCVSSCYRVIDLEIVAHLEKLVVATRHGTFKGKPVNYPAGSKDGAVSSVMCESKNQVKHIEGVTKFVNLVEYLLVVSVSRIKALIVRLMPSSVK